MQLLGSDEQLHSFAKVDLQSEKFIPSPMPSARGTLDDQEVADVVQYLVSLRGSAKP